MRIVENLDYLKSYENYRSSPKLIRVGATAEIDVSEALEDIKEVLETIMNSKRTTGRISVHIEIDG